MQRQWMKDLRERSPRVHCITTMLRQDVANMVLAQAVSLLLWPRGCMRWEGPRYLHLQQPCA